MKLIFCGGAEEIGGSCILLEIDNRKILFDCGIHPAKSSSLPDLSFIQDAGGLDAIVVTHAHMDHTGALPVISQSYPTAPIYTTPPTVALMTILLRDSIKLMKMSQEQEREIPLYSQQAVDKMFDNIRPVNWEQEFSPFMDDLKIKFFPAGHILGASCVGISSKEGAVLITGDYSAAEQITVGGMVIPDFNPDLIVTETTYGNRLHTNRSTEEKKLIEQVTKVIERKGKILIPAFALGRSQEILLLLQKAMQNNYIEKFPVYFDGMVKSICGVYSDYPYYQSNYMRRKIEKENNPFIDKKGYIKPVTTMDERNKIVTGPPCCIVASSGMLSGGASVFYASALASDEKNCIAFTGYQDEESPGHHILNLFDAPIDERRISIAGNTINFKCEVSKYSLSAHADQNEILGLLSGLKAKDVVLVHGNEESRAQLLMRLNEEGMYKVYLPANGDTIEFGEYKSKNKNKKVVEKLKEIGIANSQEINLKNIYILTSHIRNNYPYKKLFNIQSLFRIWYGRNENDLKELNDFQAVIDSSESFSRDSQKTFLFGLSENVSAKKKLTIKKNLDKSNPAFAIAKVDEIFSGINDLYKRGYRESERILILYFKFPKAAEIIYKDRIEQIEEETSWKIEINPNLNHTALLEFINEVIPPNIVASKNPSIRAEKDEAVVFVNKMPDDDFVEDIKNKFNIRTAFNLVFKEHSFAVNEEEKRDKDGKLEINQTFTYIDKCFSDSKIKPHKKSKITNSSGVSIQLSFITPELADRVSDIITKCKEKTGYNIEINPNPNMAAIIAKVNELLPKDWTISKNPSLYPGERLIKLKLKEMPSNDEIKMFKEKIIEEIGFHIEILN